MAAANTAKSVRARARTLNMAMEREREAIEEARAEHRNHTLAKRGKATSFHGLVERRTSAFEMLVTGENPSGAMFVDDRSKKSRPSTAPQSDSRASMATPRSPRENKKKKGALIQMNSKGELVAQPVPAKEEPIVESPRSPRKMGYDAYNKYIRDCDRQLGAHYLPCGEELLEFRDDEGKEDHDMLLADGLHKRRPSDLPHPRSGEPRIPMRAAFTDRAGKLREGRGMKATLMKDDHPITDWYNDADCACDICEPYSIKTSGSPSHLTTFNRHPRCAKDSPAFQPFWENPVSHTFNSELASSNLIHPNTHNDPPREEECYFKATMGRKVKSPERARSPGSPRGLGNLEDHCFGSSGVLRHRAAPGEGSLSPRPPAGCYNQDYKPEIMKCTNKARMVFQGKAPDYGERSGVALILSPRESDPPPPTKIVVDKKGDGVYKTKFTEAAQKHLAYHNQEVFRFSDPEDVKGRPVSPPCLDNCAGVTMKHFDEIITRQHPASPKTRSRRILNNTSYIVAGTMDQDYNREQAEKLTKTRHMCDEPFKNVCEYTKASKWDATLVATEVKDNIGHIQSHQVANNLMWPEA